MQVVSSLGDPGRVPPRQAGSLLVASIDVEWSKNYRISNGNQAFCYSVVWLTLPAHSRPIAVNARQVFHYSSAYLDDDSERRELIDMAAADIAAAAEAADYITGHQLCSDLGVLTANTAPATPAAIVAAREAWAARRSDPAGRIIDTRFDAGHLLASKSRRLVDVCGELDLDVTQPELARKSMTALHRDWLTNADTEGRERIAVLNLRHSLSTALVAVRAAGCGSWDGTVNVNAMLAATLGGVFGWLAHPTFRALVSGDNE